MIQTKCKVNQAHRINSNQLVLNSFSLSRLPSDLLTLLAQVKDRQVIETTDSERKCVSPAGLQESIDELVCVVPKGRSFVRWVTMLLFVFWFCYILCVCISLDPDHQGLKMLSECMLKLKLRLTSTVCMYVCMGHCLCHMHYSTAWYVLFQDVHAVPCLQLATYIVCLCVANCR